MQSPNIIQEFTIIKQMNTNTPISICIKCKLQLTPDTCIKKAYLNITKDAIKPRIAIRYECPSCNNIIIFNP